MGKVLNSLFMSAQMFGILCMTGSRLAEALCSGSTLGPCTKIRIVDSKLIPRSPTGGRFPGRNYSGLCEVKIQYAFSKESRIIHTKECPKPSEPKYIAIHFACNDNLGAPPEPDSIRVLDAHECERSPDENFNRLKKLIPEIREWAVTGTSYFSAYEHFGLKQAGQVEYDPSTKKCGYTIFHSFPGVSLYRREKPYGMKEDCIDFGAGVAIPGIGFLRNDFVSERECKMWGGAGEKDPEKYNYMKHGIQKSIPYLSWVLDPIESCKFNNSKKLNQKYVDGE